jgi:hypothetical protein
LEQHRPQRALVGLGAEFATHLKMPCGPVDEIALLSCRPAVATRIPEIELVVMRSVAAELHRGTRQIATSVLNLQRRRNGTWPAMLHYRE